jgi:hypothetical protein
LQSKKVLLYSFLFFSLFFSACQKEDIAVSNDYKTLGTSAHDLLASSTYSLLQIQIDYMPGYAPDAASITNLVNFLNTFINKPSGIQVSARQIAASGKTVLSISDIVSIEKQNRSIFTAGYVMGIHILITDADYNISNILATSYWNTSTCLFGKTIQANSGGPGQVSRTRLLSTLLEHEFGHLMGLVNQGSPMQVNHRDAANGAHCNNTACLMYYEVESISAGGSTASAIPTPDDNCIADLKANGGK